MCDFSIYDIRFFLNHGYSCFGQNFVCTLKSCKSSKIYAIYDRYVSDSFSFVCNCCSCDEALSIVRFLRKRGHEVNYIVVRPCSFLPSSSSGQLSLNLFL